MCQEDDAFGNMGPECFNCSSGNKDSIWSWFKWWLIVQSGNDCAWLRLHPAAEHGCWNPFNEEYCLNERLQAVKKTQRTCNKRLTGNLWFMVSIILPEKKESCAVSLSNTVKCDLTEAMCRKQTICSLSLCIANNSLCRLWQRARLWRSALCSSFPERQTSAQRRKHLLKFTAQFSFCNKSTFTFCHH